jgi:NAD(P)H-flavin reductase
LPIPAEIEDISAETPNIKTFRLRPASPVPFQAGQFVELTAPGVGEAPFTPSSSPTISDYLEITIMEVGLVTRRLHAMKPGDRIGIRGPLGSRYPIETFTDKEVLLIGGGCGAGPLRARLVALIATIDDYRRVMLRYGARTPDDIVFRKAVESGWGREDNLDVMMTVDVGHPEWNGHVGVVTTILEKDCLDCDPRNGVAVMCGPPLMMRFTTLKLIERGYAPENIFLSMEKNMSCGVGKCGHCRLGPYYACKQGPVFTYRQIENRPEIWEA